MAIPSRILFFLFPIILLHFPFTTKSQNPDLAFPPEYNHFCLNSANYTPNSTFQSNLRTALSSLGSNTATNFGFYTNSTGQNPNTVNALALCRGDVSPQTCTACVNDATVSIIENCPNQMQAVRWYDNCMVRYSNATVFDRVRDPYYWWNNTTNASSPREFNDAVNNLMDRLRGEAAGGSDLWKFAIGNVSGPNSVTIYGLMQCTPDLSEADCRKCLEDATAQVQVCCSGSIGGQVIGPSFRLRFESNRFYTEPSLLQPPGNPFPPPPPPPPPGALTIILITVAIVSVLVLVALIYILMRMRKRKQGMLVEQTESKFQMGIGNPIYFVKYVSISHELHLLQ